MIIFTALFCSFCYRLCFIFDFDLLFRFVSAVFGEQLLLTQPLLLILRQSNHTRTFLALSPTCFARANAVDVSRHIRCNFCTYLRTVQLIRLFLCLTAHYWQLVLYGRWYAANRWYLRRFFEGCVSGICIQRELSISKLHRHCHQLLSTFFYIKFYFKLAFQVDVPLKILSPQPNQVAF